MVVIILVGGTFIHLCFLCVIFLASGSWAFLLSNILIVFSYVTTNLFLRNSKMDIGVQEHSFAGLSTVHFICQQLVSVFYFYSIVISIGTLIAEHIGFPNVGMKFPNKHLH